MDLLKSHSSKCFNGIVLQLEKAKLLLKPLDVFFEIFAKTQKNRKESPKSDDVAHAICER